MQAGRSNDATNLEKALNVHFAPPARQREGRKRLAVWLMAPRDAEDSVVNGMPLAAFAYASPSLPTLALGSHVQLLPPHSPVVQR
jgi:hypothetical protein